jgi:large subunit ribosomal protein L24
MPGKPAKPFEGKLKIKTGDNVVVLAGKDKGRTGKVTRVYPQTGKVLVEGLNIVTKHQKARPTQSNPNPESGRIQVAAPFVVSKVALVNAEGKPTRVRIQRAEDGTRTRVAVKGGAVIEDPKAA